MKYVALLRGIAPGNPNMANSKLRELFVKLGFSNVRTFISSGNVLFEGNLKNIAAVEKRIEDTIHQKLGFTSQTIIRSKKDLDELIKENPFPEMTHNHKTSLNITFLKENKKANLKIPQEGEGFKITKNLKGAICFVVNLTNARTPQIMNILEKEFNKKVTTRTWNTVSKIHALLQ